MAKAIIGKSMKIITEPKVSIIAPKQPHLILRPFNFFAPNSSRHRAAMGKWLPETLKERRKRDEIPMFYNRLIDIAHHPWITNRAHFFMGEEGDGCQFSKA